jgi:hypothetical protein
MDQSEVAEPREKRHRKRKSGAPADAESSIPDAKPPAPANGKPRAAEIAHHTRGRVRLKIAAAKDNPALLEQIKATFSGVPGIEYIEVRPSSGSVILYYDPERHPDVPSLFQSLHPHLGQQAVADLSQQAHHRPPSNRLSEATQEIEDEAEFLAEHSSFAKAVVEYAKVLDRQIKLATDNNVDLKILVPIGLAAVTFLEIGAAAATPMWVTLVIFSLNHFVELHAHDADNS